MKGEPEERGEIERARLISASAPPSFFLTVFSSVINDIGFLSRYCCLCVPAPSSTLMAPDTGARNVIIQGGRLTSQLLRASRRDWIF